MNHTDNLYKDLAIFYDLVHSKNDYEKESKFIHEIIKSYSTGESVKLLELFCGTGLHSYELQRLGYVVHGLDSSQHMIEIAKNKEANQNIKFSIGDCKQFSFNEKYDVVIGFGQTYHYFTKIVDLIQSFTSVNAVLPLNGLLIFDLVNPWELMKKFQAIHRDEDHKYRVIRVDNTYLDMSNRSKNNSIEWFVYDKLNKKEIIYETTKECYKVHFIDELEYALNYCGFEVIKTFGDYCIDKEYEENSHSLITVARKVAKNRQYGF